MLSAPRSVNEDRPLDAHLEMMFLELLGQNLVLTIYGDALKFVFA